MEDRSRLDELKEVAAELDDRLARQVSESAFPAEDQTILLQGHEWLAIRDELADKLGLDRAAFDPPEPPPAPPPITPEAAAAYAREPWVRCPACGESDGVNGWLDAGPPGVSAMPAEASRDCGCRLCRARWVECLKVYRIVSVAPAAQQPEASDRP